MTEQTEREAVARAMWEAREATIHPHVRMSWDERTPPANDIIFVMADAAIATIARTGE